MHSIGVGVKFKLQWVLLTPTLYPSPQGGGRSLNFKSRVYAACFKAAFCV